MTGETIRVNDEEFSAYLAMPETGSGPGLVVIQKIFGVNQVIRNLCDGFAALGYIACRPDLFWRQEPGVQLTDQTEEESQKAFGYMESFDLELDISALADQRTSDFLKAHLS